MKKLIYYNSIDIFRNPINQKNLESIPGGKLFSMLFHIVGGNYVFYDRSNSIKIPLNYKLLSHLEIPKYKKIDISFSEICDMRSKELMKQAINTNRKIAIMYSGGIDSTMVVTSFFKNFPKTIIKDNILLLMNEFSIGENPNFYYNFISPYDIECIPSSKYINYIGSKKYIVISGEQSDQLYLPNFSLDYLRNRNINFLYNYVQDGPMIELIDHFLPIYKDKNSAENLYFIWKKICDNAPIKIENNAMFLWWIIFATKWQSCYFRMIPFSNNVNKIEFEIGYTSFFNNDNFQLWSMNSMQNFNIDNFKDMKLESKKYIYNFNKDDEYLKDKDKFGSLNTPVRRKKLATMIDEKMNIYNEYPTEEFINYDNDFRK